MRGAHFPVIFSLRRQARPHSEKKQKNKSVRQHIAFFYFLSLSRVYKNVGFPKKLEALVSLVKLQVWLLAPFFLAQEKYT